MGGVLRQPQGPGRTPRSLLDHFASGPTLSSLRPDLLGGVGGEGNEWTTCAWDLGGTLRSERTQPPAHGFQADGQVLGSLGPGAFPTGWRCPAFLGQSYLGQHGGLGPKSLSRWLSGLQTCRQVQGWTWASAHCPWLWLPSVVSCTPAACRHVCPRSVVNQVLVSTIRKHLRAQPRPPHQSCSGETSLRVINLS